jgi:thioredoxin-like negative regulator of GroEL
MKNRVLILLLLLLLPLQLLFAQRKNDYQQQYLQAKNLYKQERWEQAKEAFRALSAQQKNNSFVEYASFYYALSAIKAGDLGEAKAMLRQMQQRYSGWEKMEEVSYWLARVYLEEGAYQQALKEIAGIRNRQVKADAVEMATFLLAQERDITKLRSLLDANPEAAYVAKVLARKMSRQPLPKQDEEYLEQLVQTYKIDRELLKVTSLGESQKKEEYHVAVMLPFLFNDMEPESNLHDRYFVLDLYEGMKIAQQELLEDSIRIRLHAYDTKRDSLTTRSLFNSSEMAKMDLLVGPLFPAPVKIAGNFTMEQGVNMVNPLSVNPELIRNNPYSFLFKPSLATQGRRAANFAARTFADSAAVIVFGPKERDSIMAYSYKQAIEEAGFAVRYMEKIPAGEENRIRKLLVPDTEEQEQDPSFDPMKEGGRLHKKTLGHVFVASEDELIVANALSALMSRGDRLPMIGHEAWLRKNFVSFEQLERLGVYFVAPEFIDYAGEEYINFRQRYIDQVNHLPTRFAFIGYDLMMYFGRTMHQYGDLFQEETNGQMVRKGILCTNFSFADSNDNQCVPVVRFRDSALEIVYQ